MKTLIFSDTHLFHKFDQKFYNSIVPLIAEADRVIINGDFWDVWLTSFDQFINSEWKKLFPLLKEKQTIYIFGNHDPRSAGDDRVSLFSKIQLESYRFKSGKLKIACTHGHQIAPEFETRHPILTKYLFKIYPLIDAMEVWRGPVGYLKRWHRQHNDKKMWQQMKDGVLRLRQSADVVIVGHIHLQLFDDTRNLYCIGPSRFGMLNYILIDGGKITQHKLNY